MPEDKRRILIGNTADDIAPVTENIKYRHAAHCLLADQEYGERLTAALGLDIAKVRELSALSNDELNKATAR
jgi:catalase